MTRRVAWLRRAAIVWSNRHAGELCETQLFRSHEQAQLVGAIADTRTMLEGEWVSVTGS